MAEKEIGDSSLYYEKMNDSPGIELTGKILVAAMMFIFFILLLVFFLKYFSYRYEHDEEVLTARSRSRRRRLDFAADHPASAARNRLEPSVLNSIPVLTFNSKGFEDDIQCAVCLSETVDGEKVRILPKCNHGFHVDCIDMWFQSNSTCPICRNLLTNQSISEVGADNSPIFPTNVLVCGNQDEDTSLSSNSEAASESASSSSSNVRQNEMLVIDIPKQIDEYEETESPIIKQLKSLKRLLSMSRTRANPSSSNADPGKMGVEQC